MKTTLLWPLLLVLGLTQGCSTTPTYNNAQVQADQWPACNRLIHFVRQTRIQKTADASSMVVPGYPYLRINRFLASFEDELVGEAQHREWLGRLAELGREARALEWGNQRPPVSRSEHSVIESCIADHVREQSADPLFWQRLKAATYPPDHYRLLPAVVGLYPISRLFVLQGYQRWQARWSPQAVAERLVEGPWLLYDTPISSSISAESRASWLREGRARSALQIPDLPEVQLNALFDHFQPRFLVHTERASDRIGRPQIRGGQAQIALDQPRHYRLVSFTRFGNQRLLQLNYFVWFSERPPERALDIYAGAFDGLIWRVTLDATGQAMAYDSIHACGCYHKVYPVTPGPSLRPLSKNEEQPLVFPVLSRDLQHPVVVIGSGAHYVLKVGSWLPERVDSLPLPGEDYRELLQLPDNDGRRSLFAANGLLSGSERPERFLFWPMGIESAGAMRAWGTHAISFTGRRHFDSARLLEEFFWLRQPADDTGS